MSGETSKTESYENLQVGDRVKHPKFGEGQVLQRSGSGKEIKLLVAFAEEGEKQLLARYAHLKKTHPIGEEKGGETAETPPKPEEKTDIEKSSVSEEKIEDEDEFEEEFEEEEEIDEDFEIAEDEEDEEEEDEKEEK